jgi:hypothetical protein
LKSEGESREAEGAPLLRIWLQAAGLVVFAVACLLVVSVGVAVAAVWWVVTAPTRLLSRGRKSEGGSRKAEG